ncbi:MAG: hypothetical protein WKG07_24525 [Hymenobacter sp.]
MRELVDSGELAYAADRKLHAKSGFVIKQTAPPVILNVVKDLITAERLCSNSNGVGVIRSFASSG